MLTLRAAAAATVLLALTAAAFAADSVASTTVNLAPTIQAAAHTCAAIVLSIFALWLQGHVKDQAARTTILKAAENAAAIGLAKVDGALPGMNLSVGVGSQVLAEGLTHMLETVPAAAKRMGVDNRQIIDLITANLHGIDGKLDDKTINEIIASATGKPPAAPDPAELVRDLFALAQADPAGVRGAIEKMKAAAPKEA